MYPKSFGWLPAHLFSKILCTCNVWGGGGGGGGGENTKQLKNNLSEIFLQKSGPYLVPWQLAAQIILLLTGLKFWNLNNPFFC
jgi:hypothetical protein